MNSITDVGGIRVGHYQRLDPDASLGAGWACGVTVVLPPPGTVGAVDCRGGAPGTRETDLLDPANSVRFVDALLLAGGSAYGLAAADGVMRWLEEHRRGVAMDSGVVPIVPGAVIFDLPVGGWNCRPTADFGTGLQGSRCSPDTALERSGAPWATRRWLACSDCRHAGMTGETDRTCGCGPSSRTAIRPGRSRTARLCG